MPTKKSSPPPPKGRHHSQKAEHPKWWYINEFLKAHPKESYTVTEIAAALGEPQGSCSANISSYKHRLPIIYIESANGRANRYQYDTSKPDGLAPPAPRSNSKKSNLPVLADHPTAAKKNGHQINGVQRRKAHVTNEIFARVLYNGPDFLLAETQDGDIIKGKILR